MKQLAILTSVLLITMACSPTVIDTTGDDLNPLTTFQGTGGDHKADASNAVVDWQILEHDDGSLVMRALDRTGAVYLDAWVSNDGPTTMVDYLAPVDCSVTINQTLGVLLHTTCTFDQISVLSVTAVDFVRDLKESALMDAARGPKSDGLGRGVCAAAEIVVGGLGGVISTLVVFHEALIGGFVAGMFGVPVGFSVAGLGAGAAVFALGALGTAWAVDRTCRFLGLEGDLPTLAACVDDCDSDDELCSTDCVTAAASETGIAIGLEECAADCDETASCTQTCDDAYTTANSLRQTLLMQCVMGCGENNQDCARNCVGAVALVLPVDP